MKLFSLSFLMFSAFLLGHTPGDLCGAETVTEKMLFGPEVFVRDPGSPKVAVREFTIEEGAHSCLLKVQNGSMEGESQISSAVVTLNGSEILRPEDFNQNIGSLVRPILPMLENRLEVKLNSIPSSQMTVTILGYYEEMDPDGDDDTDPYIELSADIVSGIAPFDISLRIEGTMTITRSMVTGAGPAPIEVVPGPRPEEYTATIGKQGRYELTAQVIDERENSYWDTVEIVAHNKEELDSLLKSRWEEMKRRLAGQDVEGAIECFDRRTKEKYRAILGALIDQLPEIAANMREIRLVNLKNRVAEYRVSRTETIEGQAKEITYFIYFLKGADGLWRIESF